MRAPRRISHPSQPGPRIKMMSLGRTSAITSPGAQRMVGHAVRTRAAAGPSYSTCVASSVWLVISGCGHFLAVPMVKMDLDYRIHENGVVDCDVLDHAIEREDREEVVA